MKTLALASLVLLSAACSGSTPDGGGADAGTTSPDAGTPLPTSIPFPVVRMSDAQSGTSHFLEYEGVVSEHGPARENPFETEGVTPARLLQVKETDASIRKLFYTLPRPYAFAAFPNTQVRVLYRERVAGFGSSYGTRVDALAGKLVALFEDGTNGMALESAERLGFAFAIDPQPLAEEQVDCGRRVHYPVIVSNGTRQKRLFGGQSEVYTTPDGQVVRLTLFDAYRIEDSVCGDVPEFSIAYFAEPN